MTDKYPDEIEIPNGTSVGQAAILLCTHAHVHGPTRTEFNDIELTADMNTTVGKVMDQYETGMARSAAMRRCADELVRRQVKTWPDLYAKLTRACNLLDSFAAELERDDMPDTAAKTRAEVAEMRVVLSQARGEKT